MMASSYMNNFIPNYHNPKIHRQIPYTTLKPLPILQKTHLHNSLQISPIFKLHKPNSVLACSFSFQKVISKFISEKTVLVLIGSFMFMGLTLSYRRPVLAQPNVQETCQSEKIEDERDTQKGEEGEEMYVKLLEQNPKNVDALKGVVYGKMRRGETKEAVEYVERLIDVEPNEVEWRLLQAFCYEMIGELSKAKRLFKDILKQRPLLIRALHGLAMVMHKKLDEGPAVFDMLNKALEIARREKRVTEERNIRILIAQMHVVKGELQDALEQFQELVSENPRDFRPYLCQGIIYSLLDKKQEAEEQFMTYRSLVPEEYPQRNFLDDVVIAAKAESREKLKEDVQN